MRETLSARALLKVATGRVCPRDAGPALARSLPREGLGGLAGRAFPDPSQWPEGAFATLRRERADLAAVEALREQAVALLRDALGESPPVLLKGFAYGRTIYDAPEDRPCGDVDVLLPEAELDPRPLESAGFRELVVPGLPLPKGGWNTRTFKRGPVSLDLHARVFRDPPYRFPTADLLRRARPMEGRPEWRVLDRFDAICFHVAHLGKHGFRGPLIRWVDLSRMLGRWIDPGGEEAWSRYRDRAIETRTVRVARLAFAALEVLELPSPTIPAVASALRPQRADRWLVRRILHPESESLLPHRPTLALQALFRIALADDPADALASVPVAVDWVRRWGRWRWGRRRAPARR